MLESGTVEGWVVPRVQERPRLNKPPLIYWLQAGSAAILGDAPGQWAWLDGGSENIWVYRVPSLLSAIATVLLTWRLGLRMFDPRAAWLAAALLAVCPMIVWDAHQARADQLLLAMTTATMLALWNIWRPPGVFRPERAATPGIAWPVAFWLFLALGILTKGPITPLIAALTCLALSITSRDWRWLLRLRPALGVLIVVAVVAPWVILVGREVGWSNYFSIIYDETIGRSAGAKEGHWGPPGYHIVLLGVLFWPGSLLTAAAIVRACRRGLRRRSTAGAAETPAKTSLVRRTWHSLRDARPSRCAELFLIAWMLPSWIVFELVSTKLPHYTMPLYPAVALMSARALFGAKAMFFPSLNASRRKQLHDVLAAQDVKCPECRYNLRGLTTINCPECNTELRVVRKRVTSGYGRDRSQFAGRLIWIILGIVVGVGIPLALVLENITSPGDGFPISWHTGFILGGAACIACCAALINWSVNLVRRNNLVSACLVAAAVSVVSFGVVFSWLLPSTDNLWVSRRVTLALHQKGWVPDVPLRCLGYVEDSLIFLTRGHAGRMANAGAVGEWFLSQKRAMLIMDMDSANALAWWFASHYHMRKGAKFEGGAWQDPVRGFNYSTGERVEVYVEELIR